MRELRRFGLPNVYAGCPAKAAERGKVMSKPEYSVGHFYVTVIELECIWCEEDKLCVTGGKFGDAPTCLDCARQLVRVLEEGR